MAGGGPISIDTILALGLGVFSPFLIACSITVSRYVTNKYNYKSLDYSMDVFLCVGLAEIAFFIKYEILVGYGIQNIIFGIAASIF